MTRRIDVGDPIGEYVLEAKLGEGSFGEVWRARHRVLDDVAVALKFPRDPRALVRLRDEGLAARRVEAEGVVKLVGLDLDHDPPYLALELVEGGSLRDLIAKGPLPVERAVAIARRIFSALAAAHEKNVIHRDVKPENILIDEGGEAYLTDFGLAAALESDGSCQLGSLGSKPKGVVGTLRYLSPEQKDPSRGIDARSDIYSAGLVLFEMLTGALPEGGEVPSDLVPGIDEGLDKVFKRCYARLERRYMSARDVVAALDRVLERREAKKAPVRLPEPTRPGLVSGARDPRLLRAHEPSPEGMPNLIGWEEARAILRISDLDLTRFVDRGAIARVPHGGRLLFRRSDVVDVKNRMRRILSPEGIDYYVLPKPVLAPRASEPTFVETVANVAPFPWLKPPPVRPAGALVRSFAFGVDLLSVAALAVVLGTELFAGPAILLAFVLGGSEACLAPGFVDAASVAVLAFLYWSMSTGLTGRTFGKWLFGLKVIDAHGAPIGVGRAAARTLGYVVSATPLGLGFLGVLFHPEHRGFHDLVADSLVVHD
ncbi:MAG TPA: protein kinase [Planctomycetota bacterium]|nr:protein kinase [Planctomycetota bacterium]